VNNTILLSGRLASAFWKMEVQFALIDLIDKKLIKALTALISLLN